MKNITKKLVSFLVAFLAVASYAQQQGAQTLSTTTLGAAVTTTSTTNINLASLTNVTASASVQTVLWVDTEAMTVTTNSVPAAGTTVQVTRGSLGTKAETHASGRTVYVSRPNLFQGYDVAGSCTAGIGLALKLPWINTTDGNRFNCYSGGEWFLEGHGSATSAATTAATAFCTGAVTASETEFLNGAACIGATTATYGYIVTTPGEAANLRVSTTVAVAGPGDAVTVLKNAVATTVTCTIATAALSCSDSTHSFAVVAGDRLTFRIVAGAGDTAANVSASIGLYQN